MKYTVQLADGSSYDIEIPDTPTAQPQIPETPPSPLGSNFENFAAGMGQAVVKAKRGIQSLGRSLGVPTSWEVSPESASDVAEAKLRDAPLDATKAGKAGNIAGNILLTAVPAAQMQRGLQGVMGASRLATAAAAGGAGAGTEFLTNEGGLADKAKAAAVSGALGAGLTGALGALSKPFRPSEDALKLYAQGVNPTLQEGADSGIGRFVGGLTAGAQRVENRQRGELAKALVQRVSPGTASVAKGTGDDALAAAQKAVSGQYDKLLGGKVYGVTPGILDDALLAAGRTNAQGQMADEAGTAAAKAANIIGPAELNVNPRQITDGELYKGLLTKFNEAARETKNDEVKRRLLDSRKVLLEQIRDKALSPDELAALKAIDIKNFDVKRLEEAVSGAAGQLRGVSLSKLGQAYGKNQMAGNTTMEDLVGPALRTIGAADARTESQRQLANALRLGGAGAAGTAAMAFPGAAPMLGSLYGISALGQTAGGARFLMGQQNWQRHLAELLRSGAGAGVAPALVDMEGQ